MSVQLDVDPSTIHNWARQGLLCKYPYDNNRRCLYKPLNASIIMKGNGGRGAKHPSLSLLHNRNEVQYEA
jgi:hypothetical protein